MAGVMPTKRSSGRKQWTLHDEPRSSLKRLRSQLASEGCAESQVILAKQLLEEHSELEIDGSENARLGVYWLIKASEQGNIEATCLLKQCLHTGTGITEQNYMDVKTCINMTQDEKIVRNAARKVFVSLSNGEDYITSEQLQRRMLEIEKHNQLKEKSEDSKEKSNFELAESENQASEFKDWSQRSDTHNEKLTEDHVVAAAVDYSHGTLPAISKHLCLIEPNIHALDNVPFIQRSILHPLLTFQILYYKIISRFREDFFFKYFPIFKPEIQFVVAIWLYLFVSYENIVLFFPTAVFYITFILMVLTTFQMLQVKRDLLSYRVWSRLFLTYSGASLNFTRIEFRFVCNNLRPFGYFFISFVVNMCVYPLISNQWLPYSELTILSFWFTFVTLFTFTTKKRKPQLLVLLSFSVNVLARYPYETDTVVTQGWRFLELNVPNFATYLIGDFVEFCIHYRIVFYFMIPILLLLISRTENWHGIYNILAPHCVTLSWLQIVILSSEGATAYGLLRTTLILIGTILFLPLAGLTSIILPSIVLTKYLLTYNFFYNILMFVSFNVVGISTIIFFAKSKFQRYIAILQVVIGLFAFLALINYMVYERQISDDVLPKNDAPVFITWEQYQNFCHETSWKSNNNLASTQIKCSKLKKFPVNWEGYVNEVMITEIANTYKDIFEKFPYFIRNFLFCYYGERVEYECENHTVDDECLMYHDIIKSRDSCHLDKFNVYQFKLLVKMPIGLWGKMTEISLLAPNEFKNFTLKLRLDDKISFKGNLGDNLGRNIIVNLNEVACISCQNSDLKKVTKSHYILPLLQYTDIISRVKTALKILF